MARLGRPAWGRACRLLGLLAVLGLGLAQVAAAAPAKEAKLADMVITATKTPHTLDNVPVDTMVITKEDMARMPALNLVDILKTIPGIDTSTADDVFGSYTWRATMRGLSINNGYALLLVDGERLMGCGQSGGMGEYGVGLNQIPVEMVERIEIVRGTGSALYGSDAVAGVINIITKRAPDKFLAGAGASYGWYNIRDRKTASGAQKASDDGHSRTPARAYLNVGDKVGEKGGYFLQYNFEQGEDTGETPILSTRHLALGKFSGAVGDKLSYYLRGEVSDYEKQDNMREQTYRLSLGGDYLLSPHHKISLKGYHYLWDFEHGWPPNNSYGHKQGEVTFSDVQAQYSWTAGSNILTLGGEFQRQGIDFSITNADGTYIPVEEDVDTASFFIQEEITFWERLTLVLGARIDDHSSFGTEINPKLSAMYRFPTETTLRASVGRAFKSPTIRQLYYGTPYEHGDYYVASNPDLDPEIAVGWNLSAEQWLYNRQVWVSVGFFHTSIEDMVVTEITDQEINGKPLQTYHNVNQATVQGVEASARWLPGGGFSLNADFYYNQPEDDDTGKTLTYIPEFTFSLMPSYEYRPWGLGGSLLLMAVGKAYKDSANTQEVDPYCTLDLKLWKRLADRARLSFDAKNILDSDKGDETVWRTGQTFLISLDFSF